MPFFDIAYEELFGSDVSQERKRDQVRELYDFIGVDSKNVSENKWIQKYLDSSELKINGPAAYRLIPNIDGIEAELSGSQYGALFPPKN